jgi:hypothetical protein
MRRPPSVREIRHWYADFPDAGVGIITGAASGGLLVADFDGPVPTGVRLPSTPIVETTRGTHVYTNGGDGVACKTFRGGDIKAEGGYVVAPPTRIDGKQRNWLIAPEGLGTLFLPEECLADQSVLMRQLFPLRPPAAERRGDPSISPIYSCVPSDGNERAVWLEGFDSDEGFVMDVAALTGIPPVPVGCGFLCVLHAETHPSASLFREPRRGSIRYRDWHRGGEWYWITEVYAAIISGCIRKLTPSEHARWKLRLLVETGRVAPAVDNMPPLPSQAPRPARIVYAGFRLLLQSRGVTEPGQPAPFTREFGPGWCGGISKTTFENGKGWLITHGLIRKAGKFGLMGLWLPGKPS